MLQRLSIILILASLISACTPPGAIKPQPSKPQPASQAEIAAKFYSQGQYGTAARIYSALAQKSQGREAAHYRVLAADAAMLAGEHPQANAILKNLDLKLLDHLDRTNVNIIQAELLTLQNRSEDALRLLTQAPGGGIPPSLLKRYHQALTEIWLQLDNPVEAARELIVLDLLIQDYQTRIQNQQRILQILTGMSLKALTTLQTGMVNVDNGWFGLAEIVKRHAYSKEALASALTLWQQRYPQHPALPGLIDSLKQQAIAFDTEVGNIAVLLPQTGNFAKAANAIRDGILLGRLQQPADARPNIRFYDSSDTDNAWPLYNQAVSEGADFVIGPLQKSAVVQLMRSGELVVPVLALNNVSTDTQIPNMFYRYSLSPEDEARQAAERAWLDGKRRPIVLVPDSTWGSRIAEAFENQWSLLSGSVAGTRSYDASSHDYSKVIKEILYLDQSQARRKNLETWFGQKLGFEPRRRGDVDAVFLAARPKQAQSIRPQLQFHHAHDLPIYMTSHAWNGKLNSRQIQDMSGMMLPDMPWLIGEVNDSGSSRDQVAAALPKVASRYSRLYAMGLDAYSLVPELRRLQSNSGETLSGHTGLLYMDNEQQLHRQLTWLKLGRSNAILGSMPRFDLQPELFQAPEALDMESENSVLMESNQTRR